MYILRITVALNVLCAVRHSADTGFEDVSRWPEVHHDSDVDDFTF